MVACLRRALRASDLASTVSIDFAPPPLCLTPTRPQIQRSRASAPPPGPSSWWRCSWARPHSWPSSPPVGPHRRRQFGWCHRVLEGQAMGSGNVLLHHWCCPSTRSGPWTRSSTCSARSVVGVRPLLLHLVPAVLASLVVLTGGARRPASGAGAPPRWRPGRRWSPCWPCPGAPSPCSSSRAPCTSGRSSSACSLSPGSGTGAWDGGGRRRCCSGRRGPRGLPDGGARDGARLRGRHRGHGAYPRLAPGHGHGGGARGGGGDRRGGTRSATQVFGTFPSPAPTPSPPRTRYL